MKKLSIIFISTFLLLSAAANQILVNENMVVHIVCPEAVSYIQVGSHEMLIAEVLKEYPNIVRLKAVDNFSDTGSLTLVCQDQIFSIEVSYQESCSLQYHLTDFIGHPVHYVHGASLPLDKVLDAIEQMKQQNKGSLKKKNAQDIRFALNDIKVKHDLLFIRLNVRNNSNTIYRSSVPTFLMRDKKSKKAANVQEYLIEPLHVSQEEMFILPTDEMTFVMVFKSFTVPDHKEVEVSLQEITSGYTGRDLKLKFSNKSIIRAEAL